MAAHVEIDELEKTEQTVAVAQRFGNSLVAAGACCEGEVERFIDKMRVQGKMK